MGGAYALRDSWQTVNLNPTARALAALEAYPVSSRRPLDQQRAVAVRRLAQRLRLAFTQAEEMVKEIRARAQRSWAPLTRLGGISLLTAGALAGILGPGRRFSNDAQLAAYAGVAPLETSSAGCVRHRLNRGGNRRLNAVLHAGYVRHRFARALERAGVRGVRFHDLRHTSATLAHAAGASLKAVSDRLGHSTITITISADLYQHHVRQVDEDVADRLDGLLRPQAVAGATG